MARVRANGTPGRRAPTPHSRPHEHALRCVVWTKNPQRLTGWRVARGFADTRVACVTAKAVRPREVSQKGPSQRPGRGTREEGRARKRGHASPHAQILDFGHVCTSPRLDTCRFGSRALSEATRAARRSDARSGAHRVSGRAARGSLGRAHPRDRRRRRACRSARVRNARPRDDRRHRSIRAEGRAGSCRESRARRRGSGAHRAHDARTSAGHARRGRSERLHGGRTTDRALHAQRGPLHRCPPRAPSRSSALAVRRSNRLEARALAPARAKGRRSRSTRTRWMRPARAREGQAACLICAAATMTT